MAMLEAPVTFDISDEVQNISADSQIVPTYIAVASAVVLLLELALRSRAILRLRAKLSGSEVTTTDETVILNDAGQEAERASRVPCLIGQQGGLAIFVFKFARLVSCVALLFMSAFSVQKSVVLDKPSPSGLLHCGLSLTYAYASLLAFISLLAKSTTSSMAGRHLVTVLFSTWVVYLYRDVWPFATITSAPLDASEGSLLWAKLAVLTFTAAVIPLLIPRRYVPFDPKHPSEPHPEQTAPLLSILFFGWADLTIAKAYRVPHLSIDELPPLADYDSAENLVKTSFRELDPFQVKKGRHVLWGLLKVFHGDFMILAVLQVLTVLSSFANPVGIKNLLSYMETDGEGATIRPWVWISWLFLGPVMGGLVTRFWNFIGEKMAARIEAVLTQLVFNHALRMRVKADVSETSGSENDPSASVTPDTTSVTESIQVQDTRNSADGSEDGATIAASSTGSPQGKQKSDGTAETEGNVNKDAAKPPTGDEDEESANFAGRINNLITSDLDSIGSGRDILQLAIQVPVQIGLCVWFLYSILGWSAFVGLAVIILLLPLPGSLSGKIRAYLTERMKRTDARVQTITEMLNGIRMIKLFGWEQRFTLKLSEKREEELAWIVKFKMLQTMGLSLNHVIPMLNMIATFLTYTIIMKRQLTASTVFSAMTVFQMFSSQMHLTFGMIPNVLQAKVSLDRLNDFLNKTELLDDFSEDKGVASELTLPNAAPTNDTIGFCNAAFTWTNEENIPSTPGSTKRNFTLRIEEELIFKPGCINLIVGPTGSGKTSMLMALLGEMHYIPSGPDSFFHLPRGGGVAYAAQESWVQNETIRNNILFGAVYDEERYNQVIHQCGLKRDLELFDAGDETEIGEKGITLSGGQKARVTLARAVYSTASVLLLDDVLAALDVHTARWIVEKCLQGDLIRGRTVLLVTHNVSMAAPIAQFVIAIGIDGRLSSQGSLSSALEHDRKLAAQVAEERETIEKAEHNVDQQETLDEPKKSDGKLVVAEEISEGHVGWQALKLYFYGMGGKYPLVFWITVPFLSFLSELMDNAQVWYLGYWARQYEERPAEEVNALFYLAMYSLVIATGVFFFIVYWFFYILGSVRASRSIHKSLISSILGTTFRWLDKTPTSRIIARCTQDISYVDMNLPMFLDYLIYLSVTMIIKLTAVVITAPLFLAAGIFLAAAGGWIGHIYMKAELSVKREKSNARAPVIGHFGAAFTGLVSIRAYGAQDAFRKEAHMRTDRYTRASRIFSVLSHWMGIRLDILGAFFTAGLAVYLVYGGSSSASNTGFALNMAVGFSMMILWWVQIFNNFEIAGNSLERIEQYLDIEQEPKPTQSGVPPAYWPASGDLRVEKLSARYSPDGPRVLHEISFDVKSGERVGIVGRTGSGKSSLTLALLRTIITEGKVYYDSLPTDTINLDALRTHITIIPQVPELLSGTLRQNLDPLGEHDDAVLNDALRSAGLYSLQQDMEEGCINLDSQIASGGSNLSVGQKQILALARAIVRHSKLLILDEATSAIDYATDTLIQASLRKELDKGVTLLTVAHRLQTIMDSDKIIVLDAGRIVEFGRPTELLKDEKGILRALVDESGDKEALYAMAAGVGASA